MTGFNRMLSREDGALPIRMNYKWWDFRHQWELDLFKGNPES